MTTRAHLSPLLVFSISQFIYTGRFAFCFKVLLRLPDSPQINKLLKTRPFVFALFNRVKALLSKSYNKAKSSYVYGLYTSSP